MNGKRLKVAAIALIGVTAAGLVHAAPPNLNDEFSVTVRYNDLDIDQDVGAAALYRRLKIASAEVCGLSAFAGQRPISRRVEEKRCYRKALERAVQEMDHELISAMHADNR